MLIDSLTPGRESGNLHQNQLQIKLKKAELSLREKNQELLELQERNKFIQT